MMVSSQRLEGRALFLHPIADAVLEAIVARGYELASVEEILERSGTSRTEFDHHFSGKADLTTRVFEAYSENFEARVGIAYESKESWPDSLRAAAYEAVRWIRDHPEATRFGMVDVLEAGDLARLRREETFKWCARLIDRGRAVAADPEAVPAAASLIAVGAIVETLRRQQEGSLEVGIVESVAPMMYGAVRPYLGEEAALAELEIPPPADLREAGEEQGR